MATKRSAAPEEASETGRSQVTKSPTSHTDLHPDTQTATQSLAEFKESTDTARPVLQEARAEARCPFKSIARIPVKDRRG